MATFYRTFLLFLLALLGACGGGDPEPDDGMKGVDPPHCAASACR